MIRLTQEQKDVIVENCDHINNLKYPPNLPFVFSEHFAVMLPRAINSKLPIAANAVSKQAILLLPGILPGILSASVIEPSLFPGTKPLLKNPGTSLTKKYKVEINKPLHFRKGLAVTGLCWVLFLCLVCK